MNEKESNGYNFINRFIFSSFCNKALELNHCFLLVTIVSNDNTED